MTKPIKKKTETKLQRYIKALKHISLMGDGLGNPDWSRIGELAKKVAQEALKEKCPRCGK